jgi:hypothetical protein
MRNNIAVVVLSAACGPGAKPPPAAPPVSNTAPDGDGSDTPATPSTPSAPTGATIGTKHPIVVEAVARDGAWAVICQARADTDGDGSIAVHTGYHGDTFGDDFAPYVVLGTVDGERIESLLGFTRDGKWLIAMRGGQVSVLEAATAKWTALPKADVRDDGVPLGPHRAASVAFEGDRMTYFRDDDTIVIRELATGREREIDVPKVKLWRVELEPLGHWAKVYVIEKDTDKDGKLTWPSIHTSLSDRDCRGPIMSYSTGGWHGDKWEEKFLEIATGTLHDSRKGAAPSMGKPLAELGQHDGRDILAKDAAGRLLLAPKPGGHDIPDGPLVWITP